SPSTARVGRAPLDYAGRSPSTRSTAPALVAQRIEHRPPEPCAQVRVLPRARRLGQTAGVAGIRGLGGLAVGVAVPASGAPHVTAAPATGGTPSIVQLGDSVAAGEGTLYDYRYDRDSERWTGGDLDAKWPRPYPACHHSPDAFGAVVASTLAARFTQFAC